MAKLFPGNPAMTMAILLRRVYGLLIGILLSAPFAVYADPFPSGPIVIVVPFAPGGPTDLIPRMIAPKMSEDLGVPVIVENRPGASGNIGTEQVAKSKPDGQRLVVFANGLFAVNPILYRNLPFDPHKDFIPVSDLAETPNVIVVNNQTKAMKLDELLELAKSKGQQLNYSTPGNGSSPHLCMEQLKFMAGGLDIVHVPFNGGPPAISSLLSNSVQMSCININAILPSIRANRLRPLAITSPKRNPLLPDVPTMLELGFTDFESAVWFGLAAPVGTPSSTVRRLNSAIRQALEDVGVAQRLNASGLTPMGNAPEDVAKRLGIETAKWQQILKKINIVAD